MNVLKLIYYYRTTNSIYILNKMVQSVIITQPQDYVIPEPTTSLCNFCCNVCYNCYNCFINYKNFCYKFYKLCSYNYKDCCFTCDFTVENHICPAPCNSYSCYLKTNRCIETGLDIMCCSENISNYDTMCSIHQGKLVKYDFAKCLLEARLPCLPFMLMMLASSLVFGVITLPCRCVKMC